MARVLLRGSAPLRRSGTLFSSTLLRKRETTAPRRCYCRTASVRLVSTPIFYINGAPHIGHAYTATLADAETRFQKLKGNAVELVSGTDEHGTKIATAAREAGYNSCIEFCDTQSALFREMLETYDIKYDHFIRTTQPEHAKVVRMMWRKLAGSGWLRRDTFRGWYSYKDEQFLAEKETEVVDGLRRSRESGHAVEEVTEEHVMFKLRELSPWLCNWIRSTPSPIVPEERRAFVLNEAADARDVSVSRDSKRVQWGIPCAEDVDCDAGATSSDLSPSFLRSQTVYVWFDALCNYLTAAGFGEDSEWEKRWSNVTHIVGKDIIRFHAVYWPAFLHAAGIAPPSRVVAHGHWTVGGVKMSKSLGNVVDAIEAANTYGVDVMRYFLLRDGGMMDDGDFTSENVKSRRDADLANVYGNLMARSCSGKVNPMNSRMKEASFPLGDCSDVSGPVRLVTRVALSINDVLHSFEALQYRRSLERVMAMMRDANALIEETAPWALVKQLRSRDTTEQEQQSAERMLNDVLCAVYFTMHTCSVLLLPVIPSSASKVLDYLNVREEERTAQWLESVARESSDVNAKECIRISYAPCATAPPVLFPRS